MQYLLIYNFIPPPDIIYLFRLVNLNVYTPHQTASWDRYFGLFRKTLKNLYNFCRTRGSNPESHDLCKSSSQIAIKTRAQHIFCELIFCLNNFEFMSFQSTFSVLKSIWSQRNNNTKSQRRLKNQRKSRISLCSCHSITP